MLKSSEAKYKRAKERADRTETLVQKKLEAADVHAGLAVDARILRLIRPGYYEHFKSSPQKPMFYLVSEVLPHVNYRDTANAYQVKYAAQYKPHKGRTTLREMLGPDGFLTPIQRLEYNGPRFVYVGSRLPRKSSGT